MACFMNVWKEAQNDLAKNLLYDRVLKKRGPIKDPEVAKWLIGRLYLGYVRIVNKLDKCYDQFIHPQKRELIRRLVDMSLGRLLEIKREILAIELDDYVFFDNILMELRMIPDDMQIRVPQYYWRDREKFKAHQRELIKDAYQEIKEEEYKEEYLSSFPETEREVAWKEYLRQKRTEKLEREKQEEAQRKRRGGGGGVIEVKAKPVREKIEENPQEITKAVILVQRHERARQARRTLPIFKRNRKVRQTGIKYPKIPEEKAIKGAIVIQRHWRRHRKKILHKRKLEKKMLLLGMLQPSWRDLSCFDKIEETNMLKIDLQERNEEEYENALERIKEKLASFYSVSMNEDITDEIRNWFEWFFLNTGNFPDYPDQDLIVPTGEILGIPKVITKEFIEKSLPKYNKIETVLPKTNLALSLAGIRPIGGTALVVAGHWIEPNEFLIIQKEVERVKKSGGGNVKDDKKKLSKEEKAALKKKEKEEERRRLEAEAAEGFRLHDSDFLAPLKKADKDYRDYWCNLNESKNYDQRYVYDLIKEEKCYELSMQVRQVVDEAMRLELDLLKEALERDRNLKKKSKPKKPKPKKNKSPKGKKDPTGDRTDDELFIELFKNGIIREYEEAHVQDFWGERSYTAFEFRRKLEDGPPSTGDVLDLILQMCILPLGSSRIHQLSPLIRSVCLLGPQNSGKEFLARIVCTETASVLFDLTPENTAGKYTGKTDLKMLVHLVEKMSRVLQPSVILVDGAEKLFYKKVPKEEKKFDPKRLGASLTKISKAIKQEDQVLLLGISSYPWLCSKPKLTKTYERFIYVPRPDYATYYMLWQKLLTPYHSLARDFDFSCLAKASTGYSIKVIIDVVKKIMTPERIARSRTDPYKPLDFMGELCKLDQIEDKILDKSNDFYDKTEQRKRRLDRLQEIKAARSKRKK